MLLRLAAVIKIESPAIIGVGETKSNEKELFVPTVSAVVVERLGIFVFETGDTMQLLWSIEDPPLDNVVIVSVFAVLVVEGDKMFEIEKETVLPEGAELLKQLLIEICWLKGKQLKVEFKKIPADSFAQLCVKLDITGVKLLFGAPFQADGNWTVIDPFTSTVFPIVIVIDMIEVEWTILGLKDEEQLISDPGVYDL